MTHRKRVRSLFTVLAVLGGSALFGAGCGDTGPGYAYDPYGGARPAVFYDALSPYGRWVVSSPYGWAWSPYDTWSGWRPYTLGSWAYTDWGWMWLSDEPWGWAPYHYGRWAYDSFYGWVWVPGDVWAPAWVAWRYGDGYVGWAPLSPEVRWSSSSGLLTTSTILERTIDSRAWSFVQDRDLTRTDLRTRILPTDRNSSLVHRTRNTTKLKPVEGGAAERGLSREVIQRRVSTPIPVYALEGRETRGAGRPPTVRGRTISVVRPQESVLSRPAPPPNAERSRALEAQQRAILERQERERRQLVERQERERRQLEARQAKMREQEERERQRLEREQERMEQGRGRSGASER